jgi:hypothetical protein
MSNKVCRVGSISHPWASHSCFPRLVPQRAPPAIASEVQKFLLYGAEGCAMLHLGTDLALVRSAVAGAQ